MQPFHPAQKSHEIHLLGEHEAITEAEQHAMFDECFEYEDYLRANGHVAD